MNTMQNKQDSNKSEYNIMITNVSLVNTNNLIDTNEYIFDELDEDNKKIKGNMTNEAPIEGLQKLLEKNEKQLDKIIMIVSESVRNRTINENSRNKTENPDGNLTSLEFLCRKIEKYENTNMEKVEIKDEPEEKDTVETINKVKNMIEKVSEDNPQMHINIYIESNGGVRYVMFMLYNIISIMSKNNHNIILNGIYSMVNIKKPIRIKNTQNIYESSELIAIIGEYINYGRIESLKKYADKRLNQEKDDNLKKDINRCMKKLEEFSQALQLCRSERILKLLSANNEESVISYLEKFNEDYSGGSDSTNVIIFKIIFSMILSEFKGFDRASDGNNLDNIIRWCLNKDYVQQALTLSSEQLPKFLIDNKIIEFSNDFDDKFNNTYRTKGGKYEKNYYRFISYIPNIVYEEYLRSLLIEFENKTAEKLQINESEKENIINQVQCINAIFENANKNKCDEIKKFLEESEVGSNLSEEGLCFDNWLNITKAKAEEIIIKLLKVRNDNRLCEIENEIKKEIKDDLKEKVLINGKKISNKTMMKYNGRSYSWSQLFKIGNYNVDDVKNAVICKLYESAILKFKPELINEIYKIIRKGKMNREEFNEYISKNINKYKRNICCIDDINYKSNVSLDELEKTILIYGFIKEQRNTVNHAYVPNEKEILDIDALKNLMYALVDSMRKVKQDIKN
ncbi:MAG: TM1812 family CRISPR-associated protein [Lachnospira eligens]